MKVLFITSSRIGDAVLSTGLMDNIIRSEEKARITVVCGPLAVSLFEGMPNLDKIIPLKKQKRNKHWIELWKKVRNQKWDLVIDLRNSLVSRVVPAKKRYIYGRHISSKKHKVEQNASVMNLKTPPSPVLWFTKVQLQKARELIPEGEAVLALGPTANWEGKTWPSERFIELLDNLTKENAIFNGMRVAVFGAPGEEEQALPVLNAIPENKRLDLIAKTDPGTAAAAISYCDFYIGHDSGLMHCAAASGIPTVGLFGPSYPHLYGPWGSHTKYVRTPETFDELIDFPGYDPKTVGSLMGSLKVEAVEETVKAFWDECKNNK
jgi:ADP-heptose:LPS heptosyltransferase